MKVRREWIKRLAQQCNIPAPRSCTLDKATLNCKDARKKYLDAKPNSASLRKAFLSLLSDLDNDKREVEAAQAAQKVNKKKQQEMFGNKSTSSGKRLA
eukprot:1650892-Ditylum_brightwellii.AAC.1